MGQRCRRIYILNALVIDSKNEDKVVKNDVVLVNGREKLAYLMEHRFRSHSLF